MTFKKENDVNALLKNRKTNIVIGQNIRSQNKLARISCHECLINNKQC
jgi:hypothetical protein